MKHEHGVRVAIFDATALCDVLVPFVPRIPVDVLLEIGLKEERGERVGAVGLELVQIDWPLILAV
jgi:hypothetical protein